MAGGARCVWFQLSRTPAGSAPAASATRRAQDVDLRRRDADGVDAGEHDARAVRLQHQQRDLERQPDAEQRLLAAHEPEARQAQLRRRRERDGGGARTQPAGPRAHDRRSRS